MEVKLVNKNGGRLPLAKTYCEEDIVVTIDESLFDQDYTIEDALITRTLTSYTNNRVKEVGERAFQGFISLKSVEFNNVENIATYAFYSCSGLTELNFPKATTIVGNAFTGCSSVMIAKFESLTEIKTDILRSLAAMRVAYIPLVKSIAGAPFADCTGLEAIIITQTDTVASLASTNAFVRSGIANGTGYVYVPDALVDQYKSATNWSTFATQIKGLNELPFDVKEELGL